MRGIVPGWCSFINTNLFLVTSSTNRKWIVFFSLNYGRFSGNTRQPRRSSGQRNMQQLRSVSDIYGRSAITCASIRRECLLKHGNWHISLKSLKDILWHSAQDRMWNHFGCVCIELVRNAQIRSKCKFNPHPFFATELTHRPASERTPQASPKRDYQ